MCFTLSASACLHDAQLGRSIHRPNSNSMTNNLFELLLWPKLVAVSTLALTAVGGTRWKTGLSHVSLHIIDFAATCLTYVALPADHLIAVVLRGECLQRWLDDSTTQTEHEMECRFLEIIPYQYLDHSLLCYFFYRTLIIPSVCCSHSRYGHPPAAFRRRSNAADLVECPPYPESCSSHCRLYRSTRLRE